MRTAFLALLLWGDASAPSIPFEHAKWHARHSISAQGGGFYRLAVTADGRYAAVGCADGSVNVYQMSTAMLVRKIKAHDFTIDCLAFSHDGKTLATGQCYTVRLWDPETGVHKRTLTDTAGILALKFSADDRSLFWAGTDGSMRVVGLSEGTMSPWHALAEAPFCSAAWFEQGQSFAVGSFEGTIKLRSTKWAPHEVKTLEHDGRVYALAFSNDGRRLATGAWNHTLKIWNAETGQMERELKGHTGYPSKVIFTRDDRFVISGGDDATIRIWNRSEGTQVGQVEVSGSTVTGFALLHGDRALVTIQRDGPLKIWRPGPSQ